MRPYTCMATEPTVPTEKGFWFPHTPTLVTILGHHHVDGMHPDPNQSFFSVGTVGSVAMSKTSGSLSPAGRMPAPYEPENI